VSVSVRLTRGKVECNLRFEPDASAQGELILNEKLAKQLVNAANWVKMQSDEGEINPVDILRWPGVMAAGEQDLDAIAAKSAALDGTLDDFIVARETEGQALKALIEQRLEGVSTEVTKVRAHMPEVLQWQRERLVAKLEEAEVQLENNRGTRAGAHGAACGRCRRAGPPGSARERNLQHSEEERSGGSPSRFMMQEFNRESNTLASKSINADVTNSLLS
jgi:uncharacterized protein (TIGR00255 family)